MLTSWDALRSDGLTYTNNNNNNLKLQFEHVQLNNFLFISQVNLVSAVLRTNYHPIQ